LQITNGPCVASDTINIYVISNDDYDEIKLYPNPAWEYSDITIKARQVPHTIVIYNKLGQKVLILHPLDNTFNILGLEPGAYVVELLFQPNRVLRRLIVL
jgi:hypothetical protein